MSRRVLRVAADGRGDFRTVQEAIDAVPLSNRVRTVIQVAPGFYREAVYVPKTKNFITLAASQPETTILSWDNTATRINHHQVFYFFPPSIYLFLSPKFRSPSITRFILRTCLSFSLN